MITVKRKHSEKDSTQIVALPNRVIAVDLSKGYTASKELLDKEFIKYYDSLVNCNDIKKKTVQTMLKLPRMTITKMKERLQV